MPLIIKIIIPGLIIAVIAGGGIMAWKISRPAAIQDLTPSATLMANDAIGSLSVPFSTPITLSWEIKNVKDCLISGDW